MLQNNSIKLGKKGVNYVTTVVDNNNCNFHGFIQENDIGIDGIIELFTRSGIATSKLISVQIKTGHSYFDNEYCYIPVEKHSEYWKNFSLPVIGIVCTVDEENNVSGAYWTDIKEYISCNPNANRIKFARSEENKFDTNSFYMGFCSCFIVNQQIKEMTFEEAVDLVNNTKYKALGLHVLATRYSDKIYSWKIIFNCYEEESEYLNLSFFYDSITYILPHPDHYISKDRYQFSTESKEYLLNKIKQFTELDIEKMLKLAEEGISRGLIGQSIEILVPYIDDYEHKVYNVMETTKDEIIIQNGLLILANNNRSFFESNANRFHDMNQIVTDYVIKQYQEYGGIGLY